MDVYIKKPDGGMELLGVPEGSSDLAGFESWRRIVWGSDRVRAFGAEFLPLLATGDLYIEPGEVERFQRECAVLRANLEIVADGVSPLNPRSAEFRVVDGRYQVHEPDDPHAAFVATVSARLTNIEDAARGPGNAKSRPGPASIRAGGSVSVSGRRSGLGDVREPEQAQAPKAAQSRNVAVHLRPPPRIHRGSFGYGYGYGKQCPGLPAPSAGGYPCPPAEPRRLRRDRKSVV